MSGGSDGASPSPARGGGIVLVHLRWEPVLEVNLPGSLEFLTFRSVHTGCQQLATRGCAFLPQGFLLLGRDSGPSGLGWGGGSGLPPPPPRFDYSVCLAFYLCLNQGKFPAPRLGIRTLPTLRLNCVLIA